MYCKLLQTVLVIFLVVTSFAYASDEKELIVSIDRYTENTGFSNLYTKIKSGELSLKPGQMIRYVIDTFLDEIKRIIGVQKYILIVVCLNAFVTNFNSQFISKGTNNALYLGCYCIFVMLTSRAFTDAASICSSLISRVIAMLKAAVPVCISLIASIGNITSGIALKPVYLYFLEFISFVCIRFILPIISSFFALSTIGCMSGSFSVNNLTELLKKVIRWTMTATVTAFIGSISIMGIITDKIIFRGEKSLRFILSNFVPVVGRLLSETLETVAASAILIKNSIGITGTVMIALMCIPPVIKLFAASFSYKLCAALIEPICDARLSKMLSVLSSSVELMLGICITVAIIFSISVMILLTIGG